MTDRKRAREIVEDLENAYPTLPWGTVVENIAAALAAVREEAAQVIPTNWCDAMLTGPTKVIGAPPYDCQDIEQLLRHIAASIREGRT